MNVTNKFVTLSLDETFIAFILTVLNKKQSFIYETKAWRIVMSWIGVCDAEQVQLFIFNVAAKREIFLYLFCVTYAYPAHHDPPGLCFIYETLFLI